MTPGLALTLGGVFLWSLIGVRWLRDWALRHGMLAIPNARSSHAAPIPLGGGVVLVTVNVAVWLGYGATHAATPRVVAAMIVGAALIAGVSLIDDLRHVRPPLRLAAHLLGALVVVGTVGPWTTIELPFLGALALGLLAAPVTLLWIAGLTNAFNFVDGLDGMAAAQAVSAGLGWLGLGVLTGHPLVALIGGVLCASCLGFLRHNWHPASVFMGDVGATFLGFSFGILPVVAARQHARVPLVGLLLVWPAVFDSVFTVTRRALRGQGILVGHRSFLFHRLIDAGWGHRGTAALYGMLPLAGVALAFTWDWGGRAFGGLVAICTVLLGAAHWFTVVRAERRPGSVPLQPAVRDAEIDPASPAQWVLPQPLHHQDAAPVPAVETGPRGP